MTVLSHQITGNVYGETVRSILHYDSTDPLVVKLQFPHTVWEFGRELMLEAMTKGISGLDKVIIKADGDVFIIELTDDEMTGIVAYPQSEVLEFLDKTHILVPFGEEMAEIDLDAEIAKFFDNLSAA